MSFNRKIWGSKRILLRSVGVQVKRTLLKQTVFILWVAQALLISTYAVAASAGNSNFDHDKTGFSLAPPHDRLSCDSCHIRGIFKGVPRRCVSCHDRGSQFATTQKSATHVKTTDDCSVCHAGRTWVVTLFKHSEVSGTCLSCHNGIEATGKSPQHIRSSNQCDDCHNTKSWLNAHFDHSGVTGTCFSCHDGATATGKSASHINSSNTCDHCHNTRSWSDVRVDHADVLGSCFSCHNGVVATGKTPDHEPSGNACDDCHSTNGWTPARD